MQDGGVMMVEEFRVWPEFDLRGGRIYGTMAGLGREVFVLSVVVEMGWWL